MKKRIEVHLKLNSTQHQRPAHRRRHRVQRRGAGGTPARGVGRNASVVARGNATVEAWENGQVEAGRTPASWRGGTPAVEAWETPARARGTPALWRGVFCFDFFPPLRIKASAHVAIMIHGPARKSRRQADPSCTSAGDGADVRLLRHRSRNGTGFVAPTRRRDAHSIERHKTPMGSIWLCTG